MIACSLVHWVASGSPYAYHTYMVFIDLKRMSIENKGPGLTNPRDFVWYRSKYHEQTRSTPTSEVTRYPPPDPRARQDSFSANPL